MSDAWRDRENRPDDVWAEWNGSLVNMTALAELVLPVLRDRVCRVVDKNELVGVRTLRVGPYEACLKPLPCPDHGAPASRLSAGPDTPSHKL